MKNNKFLLILLIIAVIYPLYSLFQAGQAINEQSVQQVQNLVNNYRLSIWISWVVVVSVAVYHKWNRQNNLYFSFTYIFLLLTFAAYGYLVQVMANSYNLPTRFEDNYSLGVFTTLQNLVIPVAFTIFLQAAVWWFTRRWHRK